MKIWRITSLTLLICFLLPVGAADGATRVRWVNGIQTFYDSVTYETVHVMTGDKLWVDFYGLGDREASTADVFSSTAPWSNAVYNSSSASVANGTTTYFYVNTGTADDDDSESSTQLSWYGSKSCVMEAAVRVDAPTCAFNVGFTDAKTETADLLPIVCANVQGVTSTASDAALFFFDYDTTTDYIRCAAVNNDVDSASATAFSTAITTYALAHTWHTYRVEIDDSGNVDFWFDGAHIPQISAGVAPGIPLCAYVGVINRSGATVQMDVKYVRVWQK